MTNLEFWKDYLKKFRSNAVAVVGGVPQLCRDVTCSDCLFYHESCNQCSQFYDWLAEEYKEPAIDWKKVPPDTDVMVRSIDSEDWEPKKFALYLPGADPKYFVFGHGYSCPTREAVTSLEDIIGWEQCMLVHLEDVLKYRKDGQADEEKCNA